MPINFLKSDEKNIEQLVSYLNNDAAELYIVSYCEKSKILTANYFTNYFIGASSEIGPISKYGRVKSDLKLITARAVF
jgi:hypothetical protein